MKTKYKRIKLIHGTMLVDDEDWQKWKHIPWYTHLHHTGKYYVVCAPHYKKKYNLPNTKLHRLILKAQPGEIVDHIRNTLDNRRDKLRLCTSSQNSLNRRMYSLDRKTSIYKGVSFDKETGKWSAHFRGNRLGRFETQEEAAKMYNKEAKNYDAEFAKINRIR